jgi:NADP-dependent 3-hydroxy acid dehydrogenase YdfG
MTKVIDPGALKSEAQPVQRPAMPVFLITGASTGIGAATARQAAQAGYDVVLAARSEDKLKALADEVGGLAVRCDVTEWEDQQALVARALEEYGRIDVAFANAGFGGPRGFMEGDVEEWRRMILTNVYGCALTIRATMPALRESRGHLLLTSSVAGRRALPGSLYSATKHAVTAMGEAARLDYNDSGVRVTLIEPGLVDTPFFDDPVRMAAPLQAEDIARVVMFAVSQPPHVDVNEILVRPTAQPT